MVDSSPFYVKITCDYSFVYKIIATFAAYLYRNVV